MKNLFKITCLMLMASIVVSCSPDDDDDNNNNNNNNNPLANVDYYIKGKKNGVPFNVTTAYVASNSYNDSWASPKNVQFYQTSIGGISGINSYGIRMMGLATTTEFGTLQEFRDFFKPGTCLFYNNNTSGDYVENSRYFYLINYTAQSDYVDVQPNGSHVTITDTMHTTFTNPIGNITYPAVKYKCTFQFQMIDANTLTTVDITEGEGVFVSVKYD
jgi:hypothetical protein